MGTPSIFFHFECSPWIGEHQLGRRNLSDDQRAMVANDVREVRSEIAKKERAETARQFGGKATPEQEQIAWRLI